MTKDSTANSDPMRRQTSTAMNQLATTSSILAPSTATSTPASNLHPYSHPNPMSHRRQLSHHHAFKHTPIGYTFLCILTAFGFFYQPYEWRIDFWHVIRSVIEDEKLFLLVGLLTIHLTTFLIANLSMLFIYYIEHPFFEQFKIDSRLWPWQRSDEERSEYFQLIRQSVKLTLCNQLVVTPLIIWTGFDLFAYCGLNGQLDSVPAWHTSTWQIIISMVIEDTVLYWTHRLLHHPLFYGSIHKIHHQYSYSIGLASEHAHPIEFIFGNIVPFALGPMICGMHYLTLFLWSILLIGEAVDGHSGYEFPWSPYRLLPFNGSSTVHDYHHSHNRGNFSSLFTWWDSLMETNQPFRRHEEQLIIIQQHKSRYR